MGKIETQARFFFSPKAAGKGLENCSLEANLIIGYQYYRVSTAEPHLGLQISGLCSLIISNFLRRAASSNLGTDTGKGACP